MTPPMIPPKGSGSTLVKLWWFVLPLAALIAAVALHRDPIQNPVTDPFEEYLSLASKINQLEVNKMMLQDNDANANASKIRELNQQIAALKPRLTQLEPAYQKELERRRVEDEADAKRRADEAAEKQRKEYEKTLSDFQKRCNEARSKKIADLTVNDLELLKECGVSVQGLPRVQ